MIVLGEDIGPIGGIFGLTRGLHALFGETRVPSRKGQLRAAPEGTALSGLRPVAEIHLFDFVTLMMDGIVNQAAKALFMLQTDEFRRWIERTSATAPGGLFARRTPMTSILIWPRQNVRAAIRCGSPFAGRMVAGG